MTVGCGTSPSVTSSSADTEAGDVYASFDRMADGERMDALIEAAETEGAVTVYLRSDDRFAEIEAAFEAEYRIDLTIVNPGTTEIVQQQIFEQTSAGRVEADVVETYVHELNLMYADQDVVAETPVFLAETSPDPELVSDFAIETFQYPFVPVWNTNAVAGGDVPTSFEDFADPMWKDKLVLVKNYYPWYLTMFQALTSQGMPVSEFEDLLTTIASYSSTADSSNPAATSIASGQYLAGPGVAVVAPQRLGPTAPVAYDPVIAPAPLVPVGIGLIKEAAHPAAAMLFAHWYLTKGTDIIVDEQYVQQNPKETDLAGVEGIRPDTSELTTEQLGEWRQAYENLVTGSTPILPEYVHDR